MKVSFIFAILAIFLSSVTCSPSNDTSSPSKLRQVYNAVNPSVCKIMVDINNTIQGVGSGYLLEDDLVVSAKHVHFDIGKNFEVRFPNKTTRKVLEYWRSNTHDVVFFRIEKVSNIRPLKFAKWEPKMFDEVMVVGYPLMLEEWASTGRFIKMVDFNFDDVKEHYLGVSSPIYPGNSGGPGVNMSGEVVGICYFVLVDDNYGNETREGLAFLTSSYIIRHELLILKIQHPDW